MPEAARTLVKSPPELWAEVSDPTALARHLGAFGDIRITRLEPEATVAWEGDRASGTVALEPTGWGTKVTVAAEPVGADAETEAATEPATVPAPVVAETPPAKEPPPAGAEPRRGFLARLLRRGLKPPAAAEAAAPDTERRVDGAEREQLDTRSPEDAQPAAAPVDADAVLAEMLASLGAAHHRPFSRG